ncbi:MAG: Na/Pi cotransporter family protein [Spirochaetales bacterium]|nr:Na/Pi cotransporter family protein [Spirochaetales bacterium]
MTPIEILTIITTMLGGLALFLSGMDTLSDSLTSLTGGALKKVIGGITKNRFLAYCFGTVVTAIVQSSSAITVLSVGLVNSGIIELGNAAGLVIGANLGTTATAWMLSLNAIDGGSLLLTIIKPSFFSPVLAIIGVAMRLFCKSEKTKITGSALLGFAIMMIGMNLMSQGISPLKSVPSVRKTLISFANPVAGFLVACAFTMLIQSSDAIIGIVQAFALSIGMSYGMSIPLICGAQVGTCITALLSSLGTTNNGKRTALLNLYYNLLKTIPIMVIFYSLNALVGFSFLKQDVGGIGIPVVHTLLNLIGSVVWLSLAGVIVSLAKRTIPLSEAEHQEHINTLTMLDKNLLRTPPIALSQANKAVVLLSKTVGDAFLSIMGIRQDSEKAEQARLLCKRSERFLSQIDDYLLQISEHDIENKDMAYLYMLGSVGTAFGRMGKASERILEMIVKVADSPEIMTQEERKEIDILGEAIYEIIQLTINNFTARNTTVSKTIQYYREEIMELSAIAKRRHVRRIHKEGRHQHQDMLYTDICYAQEQLIDYCDMTADALIRYQQDTGAGRQTQSVTDERSRKQIHELFRDKYEVLGFERDE